MSYIKLDGILYEYSYYEDIVKPAWKIQMYKEDREQCHQ